MAACVRLYVRVFVRICWWWGWGGCKCVLYGLSSCSVCRCLCSWVCVKGARDSARARECAKMIVSERVCNTHSYTQCNTPCNTHCITHCNTRCNETSYQRASVWSEHLWKMIFEFSLHVIFPEPHD